MAAFDGPVDQIPVARPAQTVLLLCAGVVDGDFQIVEHPQKFIAHRGQAVAIGGDAQLHFPAVQIADDLFELGM